VCESESATRVLLDHHDSDAERVDLDQLVEDRVIAIGESPAEGSSNSKRRGCVTSARASATSLR